jgi:RNA polymerase sigma-70 factor (ECF subfamily)
VQQDDGELIRATLGGDSAAFGMLVRKHQDRLLTSLTHVCGSRDEAEDVAQEAFVHAYLKLASFAGGSAFYTWLYRIAFNAAISRRRKRRDTSSVDYTRQATGGEPLDLREGAEDRVLRQERAAQLQQALSRLGEEFRVVLVLREIDGCDYETIAQILGLPVGTVRSRLHRARLQLKEELASALEENPDRHQANGN